MKVKSQKILTDDLLTLCYIFDKLKEFENNVNNLYENSSFKMYIYDIEDIVDGKKSLGKRKLKKFYKENKDVIDIINENTSLGQFISKIYNEVFYFFISYLKDNEEDLNNIISLLEKMQYLEIKEIIFNPDFDFTKETYHISSTFPYINKFYYLDNIEIIPNYDTYIKYETAESNYKLEIQAGYTDFCKFGRKIFVNSLVFSEERLPDKISRVEIFDKLIEMKKDQSESIDKLRTSVDLSVGFKDLNDQMDETSKLFLEKEIDDKEKIKEGVEQLRKDLEVLLGILNTYNSHIIKENSNITEETLKEETEMYLKRRKNAWIDDD